jgi:hypothetical protein
MPSAICLVEILAGQPGVVGYPVGAAMIEDRYGDRAERRQRADFLIGLQALLAVIRAPIRGGAGGTTFGRAEYRPSGQASTRIMRVRSV